MSGVLLCSKESKNPYYIKDIDINVYSLEEIVYYVYNYLFLIDKSFFNENFIYYLENDLDEKMIANGIKQLIEKKGKLKEMIVYLLKSSSYYTLDELKKFYYKLDEFDKKSEIEHLKEKGDVLLKFEKYNGAFHCYRTILSKNREVNLPQFIYGNVYNNMGIVCANMEKYDNAREYFKEGFRISRDMIMVKHALMCDMISNNNKAFEEDVSFFNVSQKIILECREKIKEIKEEHREDIDNLIQNKEELMKNINKTIHLYKVDNL